MICLRGRAGALGGSGLTCGLLGWGELGNGGMIWLGGLGAPGKRSQRESHRSETSATTGSNKQTTARAVKGISMIGPTDNNPTKASKAVQSASSSGDPNAFCGDHAGQSLQAQGHEFVASLNQHVGKLFDYLALALRGWHLRACRRQ